jgi:CBS domain-containing protein
VQRGNAKALSMTIRDARDMHALEMAADEAQKVARRMLSEGVAAEQVMQTLSTLNDLLAVRVVELTRREFTLPAVPWCWLAFGSEGRFEQTLATDQDNGLVFECPPQAVEATRQAFLPFAAAVNDRLDTCGFPLCKGNIMASNPELCLSTLEWRDRFTDWMRCGDPQAMLNATIFFDFRPIYGQESLAEELRRWLEKSVPQEGMFLRFMAETAVKAKPPLGLIRDFVFDDDKAFPNTLDLKAFGSRIFVDAARILALAHGVGETSTAERLRTLVRKGALVGEDVEAMVDGFFFIQKLRLLHQREDLRSGEENRIDPDKLNELDRAVLKIAFKQSKKLQDVLQLAYRV